MSDDQSIRQAQVHDTAEALGLVEELEQRLGQLKDWQRNHDEFIQQLKAEQAELNTRQNELAEHGQRLQQWQQQLDAQRGELDGRDEQLSQWQDQLQARQHELDERTEQLGQWQREVEHRRRQAEAQLQQIQAQQDAADDLEQQRLAIEQSQQELDQARGEHDAHVEQARQELEAREDEIAWQQRQIEQARQEIDEHRRIAADNDAQRRELDQLQQAVNAQRGELDQQQQDLAQQHEQLQEQVQALEAQRLAIEADQSQLTEAQATIADQREQLNIQQEQSEVRHRDLDHRAAEIDAAQDQATDLEKTLTQRQAALGQEEGKFQQKKAAFKETLRQAKEHVLCERDQVRQVQEQVEQQKEKLDHRTATLKRAAHRTSSRRLRLKRYRQLLRDESTRVKADKAKTTSLRQQYDGLLKQRQLLTEAKRFLSVSETEMLRRWATHKAAGMVVWSCITLVLLALGSYYAADRATKPLWRVTMALQYDTTDQQPTETGDAWLAAKRRTLFSKAVLGEAINQLGQRGYRPFENTTELRDQLESAVVATSPQPGHLALEYRHTDKKLAVFMLESLGRGMLGHQMSQDRAADRDNTAQIIQAAAHDQSPVENRTPIIAAQIFAVAAVSAILILLAIRVWLMRSKRLLDNPLARQALAPIENEDMWQTPADQSTTASSS